jgi:hypothetical protein
MAYSSLSDEMGSKTETAPATDTASSGLNGRLQRVSQRLSTLIGLVPAALSAGGNLKVSVAEGGAASGVAGTPSADVISVQEPTTNTFNYAAPAGGLVTTADVSAKGAAGSGIRNFIKRAQIINSHQTIGTEVVIKDGSTVLFRAWCEPKGGGVNAVFDPPLKGTANTAINIAEITATATAGVLVNLQGFTGA